MKKPIALIIMDGYGYSENTTGNAIAAAKTPNIDKILAENPNILISASGNDVGLPDGQMGNSEVGHTNIGAGRVVYQDLVKITKDIEDGKFFSIPALVGAMENCKKNNSALHLMGLLSDGGVHSHHKHLFALLQMAKEYGVNKVYIHAFLDGRDVSPTSGIDYVKTLTDEIKKIGVGSIATVMGRYYSMDRDNAWDRVQKAYDAMVYGIGEKSNSAIAAVENSYDNDITDEFVLPTICDENGKITKNDSIVFFNYRPDRARQITRTLVDADFTGFKRKEGYFENYFVCMTQYDALMPNVHVAYEPRKLTNTFGEYISNHGLKQLRIAETQKYAHVTFFFNGGVEEVFPGEDRILIPSPTVATFDMQPEMSAYEVTDALISEIEKDTHDVIILNYANCDMVGHTGDMSATIKAVEAVDECVGKITNAIAAKGGISIVTADHGNADKLLDEDGNVYTAHSTNLVPLVVLGADVKLRTKGGKLADIAPTMLELMGMDKPVEMDGESLIVK